MFWGRLYQFSIGVDTLKGFSKVEKIAPQNFQVALKGRKGVIFFKDYWWRGNEKFENRSGDHIDLWSEDEITGGSMLYRSMIELLGFVSDLNKSKEIWFWEVVTKAIGLILAVVFSFALNFLLFSVAYNKLATPFLNESQRVENAAVIMQMVLPGYVFIAIATAIIYFFIAKKKE